MQRQEIPAPAIGNTAPRLGLIITHKSGMPLKAIPEGLCPPAQGCEPASYPGILCKPRLNPNGVVVALASHGRNPVGVGSSRRDGPSVARSSQPFVAESLRDSRHCPSKMRVMIRLQPEATERTEKRVGWICGGSKAKFGELLEGVTSFKTPTIDFIG